MAEHSKPQRITLTLDDAHAEKLRRWAERAHATEGELERSLLSTALDEANPNPLSVTSLLDRIPGAFERGELGLAQVRGGEGMPLGEL